ncbi:hypothetical protein ABFS83_13G175600 [Erythranthe nasuta]
MTIPSAFEMVGHIAHLNLRDEHLQYKHLITKVVLDKNKPKIKTVVNKVDAIHNDYRTMQLEVLAGNNSLVTTLVENGLRFQILELKACNRKAEAPQLLHVQRYCLENSERIIIKKMMACGKFRRYEDNRLKALARLANQRLQELMEADELKKKNRNKRKIRSKPVFEIPDDFVDWEVEYEEQQEQEDEEYSDHKASAAAKRRKTSSSNNNNSPKKKKESSGEGSSSSQPPPCPLPEEFKEVIRRLAQGGKRVTEEKLVIQKGLFKTDLAKGNNRLSIPFTQVLDHTFLTDDETHFLTTRDGNNKMNFKEVTIIEPSLELEKVKLCRWDMNKANGKNTSSNYVLNGAWSNVAQRNHLEPEDVVQLWSFRIDQELHLALVKIPHNNNNN